MPWGSFFQGLGDMLLLFAIGAYVVAQMGIAVWASRRLSNQTDYLVAGRQLGVVVVAMSLFATWFGAETVLGSSGAIAEGGLSEARAEPFGYAVCLVLMGLLVAGKLRAGGYLTLGDFFRDRFGPVSETLCVIVNVATSITWGAAQLTALAMIISSLTDLPVQWALAGTAILVIIYVTAGGLMGDVVTDVIQGGILIIGLILLLIAVIAQAGGVGEAFALIEPESLNLIGPDESLIERLDTWAIPILGSLVTVEAVGRFLGAKSAKVAQWGAFGGAGIYLVIGCIPALIGLIGGGLGLPVGEGDDFLPVLAQELLSPVLMVVLIGALLSAVLSTVDSNILGASGLLTRNLLDRFRPNTTERGKLWSTRLVTISCGLAAWAIAARGESILTLVEWTSALGTSGVLIAFLFGAWSRVGGERAAIAAIAAGLVSNVVTMLIPAVRGTDEVIGAFLISILVSLVFYLLASAAFKGSRHGVALLGE